MDFSRRKSHGTLIDMKPNADIFEENKRLLEMKTKETDSFKPAKALVLNRKKTQQQLKSGKIERPASAIKRPTTSSKVSSAFKTVNTVKTSSRKRQLQINNLQPPLESINAQLTPAA
jgi:hypothetical protein